MTAVKTVIGALEEARDVLLQRVSGLTALQTQRAIEELVAQIAAVSASVANAAPKTAQYIVTASDATLTAERVATDTATITWDFATAGQAKANFIGSAGIGGTLGTVDNAVPRADGTAGSTAQGSLVTIDDTGIMNGATAVGINATADTTNRLSVNSGAVLFNHNGTTSQVKVNKAATGNTASHLFQVGFSGRAEFGLIGTDDFTLKTSPDGSVFTTALTALNATGALRVGVNLSPVADDGAALGTTALKWSDAFWASGAVLNFNNGNITITHASGTLTYSGTAGLTQTHLYTGADGTTVFSIDAGGSSLNNSPALTLTVPTTGAQKGFQITTPGATASWVSFELAIGGAGKPGFILGPGSAVRDTNLYRDAADVLKTDDALTVSKDLTVAAGTTAIAPIRFQSGTNLTTAAAGAVEYDGKAFYATSVASARQVVNAEQISILTSNFTGQNVNTAQPIFSAAQDTITLAANTMYEAEGFYYITRVAGTTSHTTSVLFGGTAVASTTLLLLRASNPSGNALSAVSQIVGTFAGQTITAANTSATENIVVHIRGTIPVTTGGTLIPQFQYSAAPGGVPTVFTGTFFRVWPVGADTVATVGNWS